MQPEDIALDPAEAGAAGDNRIAAAVEALFREHYGRIAGMLAEERRQRVRAVLGALKPREAQLLLLRASGLAYRELAGALGVEPASVGTMLARAEAEFERRFRARYGEHV
jgi:DNA-directed RNA polymerase specialized sigma24 family protein